MALPFVVSQSRPVLSPEAVTTRRPSGLNRAELTAPLCFMGWPTALPVAASHSRAVLSPEAVTTHRPSALNSADAIAASDCISSVAGMTKSL